MESSPRPRPLPEVPSSFFDGLPDVPAKTTITSDLHVQDRPNSHVPVKAMMWYDAIIDDMFANPGTTQKATAQRLNRSAVTIGYVVNSDMFKARYAQRRDQFNEELDQRLIGKLAQVAELSLDYTIEKLNKVQSAVPLPMLHDIADKALNRLGYGPKGGGPSLAVTVNANNGGQQIIAPVSADALAAARSTLRTIENKKFIESSPAPSQAARAEGEGGDV